MQDAPSLTKNGKAIYGERKNFQGKQIERAVESQINSVIKSKNMEPEVARAFSRNVEETLRIVPTKVDGKTVYTPSYRPEGGGEEFFYVNTPEGPDVLTINVDRNKEAGVVQADMQTALDNVAHDLVTMGLEDRKGPVEGFFDNSRPDITGRSTTGKALKALNKDMMRVTEGLKQLEAGKYQGNVPDLLMDVSRVVRQTGEFEQKVLEYKAMPDAPMDLPTVEGSVESSMEITSEETFPMKTTGGGLEEELDQIKKDEGVKKRGGDHYVYKDSLGLATAGHGHLLTSAEKKKYPVGSTIPQDVVDKWLAQDTKEAKADVKSVFGSVKDQEAEKILFNMAFNLGRTRLDKFNDLKAAVKAERYEDAAAAMKDSKWYGQVGNRSKRLVARMKALGNK